MMDVKGFLIDIDGVLYTGDRAIDGAQEAIASLKEHKLQFRFVSNATLRCRRTIAARLTAMGFDIAERAIFTPPQAAVAFMKSAGKYRYHLLTARDVHCDFPQIPDDRGSSVVDYVIVGDAGDAFTYASLNAAFRHLEAGAELLALERDRYWMATEGLSLSAGPFVAALEYASGKTATVLGKPSPAFFSLALQEMHIAPADAAMIGDDIATDIGGAQRIGMQGILVRTGKFREDALRDSPVTPSRIVNSIADLPEILT
jgi:HAD superfamily hydrolase (TIGR01458 family)